MHAFACILFALAGAATASYGPPPPPPAPAPAPAPNPYVKLCCPNGAGKGACTDKKGKTFDATCCSGGLWKCQQAGVYEDVCTISRLTSGAECPAPPPTPNPAPPTPPAPAPAKAKKCCKPRSTPKMCPGEGYGSEKVPAFCCADGKYRCGSCDDFGGKSKKCKCCDPANQLICDGKPGVCCNDGKLRCANGLSAFKVCKPYLGKGKKCAPRPAPAPCCNPGVKIACLPTDGYGANVQPQCCNGGSWSCDGCGDNGGEGTPCYIPEPAPAPKCCTPGTKIACLNDGSYGGDNVQPKCCNDGSWSCGECEENNGIGNVCPEPAPAPAPEPACCNNDAKIACEPTGYGTVVKPKCCKDGSWSCASCKNNGGTGGLC